MSELFDALPLEYKLEHRRSSWNDHILDSMDEPVAERVCTILGRGLAEEIPDLTVVQRSLITDYSAHFSLVAKDRGKLLPDACFF